MLEILSEEDKAKLEKLATMHYMTLNRDAADCYIEDQADVTEFYRLVKKATINGLPDMELAAQARAKNSEHTMTAAGQVTAAGAKENAEEA